MTASITKENRELAIQRQRQRYGLISGQLIYDTRVGLHSPYKGFVADRNAEKSVKYSGDSRPYTKIWTDIDAYFPVGQTQILNIGGFMGTSMQEVPIFEEFRVGGAWDLPGYHIEEIWGRHVVKLHFRYRIIVYKKWYAFTNASLTKVSNNALMLKQPIAGMTIGPRADSP